MRMHTERYRGVDGEFAGDPASHAWLFRIGLPIVCLLILAWSPLPAQTASGTAAATAAPDVGALGWMAGRWTCDKDGGRVEEQWSAPAGQSMLGTSCTVAGGRTAFFEFMRIGVRDGAIYYTAHPMGGKGTDFKLVRSGPREAIFENPAHDFPQRIIYRREPGGRLLARVEGRKEDKDMAEEFPYLPAGIEAGDESGLKVIRKEAVVETSLAGVWEAWTTSAGAQTFFAPAARVELAIGGMYELYFAPEKPAGSRGSEGCTVLSFLPRRMLSFSWNAPPHLPGVRQERTWVVVTFEPLETGQVKVSLTHLGWKEGEEWEKAFQYFTRAWDVVLERLRQRFAAGPVDWSKL